MKRIICIGSVVMLIVVMFSGCSLKYNETFIVGRSMKSIVKQFGEPDGIIPLQKENGEHTGTRFVYKIKEERVGFLGTDPAEFFSVYFDLDGNATGCKRYLQPGG